MRIIPNRKGWTIHATEEEAQLIDTGMEHAVNMMQPSSAKKRAQEALKLLRFCMRFHLDAYTDRHGQPKPHPIQLKNSA